MTTPDELLTHIASYVCSKNGFSEKALESARYCLMDTLGCGILASRNPECMRLVGPLVPVAGLPGGARVPGTGYELDPVQAAFCIGTMNRWLDFNDAWAGAEWGHPSDNLGGILAVADYLSRTAANSGNRTLTIRDVLLALIKAYEIQGVIALKNSFNRLGFDHVALIRIATSAVVTDILGGSSTQVVNAVSNAFLDGLTLRTYRANTGTRKNWAAGDATSRGVRLALMSLAGEMGYPSALSEPGWGFQDVFLGGVPLSIERPFGEFVVNNIVFKVPFPAEGHALTACEAAVRLHPKVQERLEDVSRVVIETQESAMRIIDKTGTLKNPADRDHCLQYMVAVALIKGDLRYEYYEDDAARDPRIDVLREKMEVSENSQFTRDYQDEGKRSVANAVQVYFDNGERTERVEIEYPPGHPRRRSEGTALVLEKFDRNVGSTLPPRTCGRLVDLFSRPDQLDDMPVSEFMGFLVV